MNIGDWNLIDALGAVIGTVTIRRYEEPAVPMLILVKKKQKVKKQMMKCRFQQEKRAKQKEQMRM